MAAAADAGLVIEHAIQQELIARLGIAWTPGEPFYALIEDHINALRAELADLLPRMDADALTIQTLVGDNRRLVAAIRAYLDDDSDANWEALAALVSD